MNRVEAFDVECWTLNVGCSAAPRDLRGSQWANKQIADALGIAEITAKVHVSHILEMLGAPDRTRAATLAIERGIIRL